MFLYELSNDRGKEQSCPAPIPFAPLEEKASAEHSSVIEFLGYGTRDGRFSCTSHAIQPEYAFAVGIVGPFVNLAEKVDSSVGMTLGGVFVGVRIECGTIGSAQLAEQLVEHEFVNAFRHVFNLFFNVCHI